VLKEMIRILRPVGDHFLTAFCQMELGRIRAMTGRIEDALELFAAARDHYAEGGAPGAGLDVDAWEADTRLLAGDPVRALEICGDVIVRLGGGAEVNILTPMLDRLLGYGLAQTGDLDAAAAAFERSVAGARAREAVHEVALSLLALARLARLGGTADPAVERELETIVDRLGISALPAYPLRTASV
jgi:hypothetical protein